MLDVIPVDGGFIIKSPKDKTLNKKFSEIKNKRYDLIKGGWFVPDLNEVHKVFNIKENKEQIADDCKDMGKFLKYEPYSYQKEAIKFCLDNPSALLILPCGAGSF